VKINSRTAAGLKLPANASDVIHFDSELVGFGCRIRRGTDGKVRKSFVVQYRRGRQTRRIKLDATNALTAEQARAAARTILAQVALGDDPQADRLGRRDARSLRSVVVEYLAAKQDTVRPATYRAAAAYLTGSAYFGPLHTTAIDQITRADIAGRLVVISRESSANTASLCRAKLGALFTWAIQMGLTEANPTVGTIRPEGGKARERVLTDDELAAVWRACQDDDHGRIVRLLMLTACRRQEVGGMTWSEVDQDGVWTIPGNRTKNHREHALPLPAAALAIITAVPRMVDRDHLFGVRGEGFRRWSAGKAALDERAGVAAWTLHDIRRSVATRMADLGVQPHIVETILNHQSGHKDGVAGTYNRSIYEAEVRAALAMWCDHVTALVSGKPRKITAIRPARKRAA
jgi:integrase